MAATASKPRSGSARSAPARAKTAVKKTAAKKTAAKPAAVKKTVAKVPAGKAAKSAVKKKASGLVLTAGEHALRGIGRKAAAASAQGVRSAVHHAVGLVRPVLEDGLAERLSHPVPIQVSIDVAAPPAIVWAEWTAFDAMTEGVHRIEQVQRDGDELIGRTAAPHSTPWRAEIVDERQQEAFAWRSVEGSDCAGLVTFHQLSERLTRIELDLDVIPTGPFQALALSFRWPTRRAETELRRFKARVEFINPDVYQADLDQGNQDDRDSDPDGSRRGAENDE